MGEITPAIKPTSGFLGFFETTLGRSIRRALVLAGVAAVTTLLGAITNDPAFSKAVPTDIVPFCIYWLARTAMDYFSPSISNR